MACCGIKLKSMSHAAARKGFLVRGQKRSFATGNSDNLVKTALNELHKELKGDMVPFAGYELPVLYKGENGGVMKEHLWCREDGKASLFDVSHMGQVRHSTNIASLDLHHSLFLIHFWKNSLVICLCVLYFFVCSSPLYWK